MAWFNIFGLCVMVIIMIPNIIYAIKCKDSFKNKYNNKAAETLEQIGRFCCFGFMIINIPGTVWGFCCDRAFAVYLIGAFSLAAIYCVVWAVCFKTNGLFKALSLSIIPSVMFLFCGIMSRSILLIIGALIFAPCHILISYKNAKQ